MRKGIKMMRRGYRKKKKMRRGFHPQAKIFKKFHVENGLRVKTLHHEMGHTVNFSKMFFTVGPCSLHFPF